MRLQRFVVLSFLLGLPLLWSVPAFAGSLKPTAEDQERVAAVLSKFKTNADLDFYAEGPPAFCAEVSSDSKVCSWYFNNQKERWAALVEALNTKNRYQIMLVCELPVGGGNREPDSCRAYPKHYSAGDFYSARWTKKARERASATLAAARTLWQLIDLVGVGPKACKVDSGELSCVWPVSYHTIGYSLLARTINSKRKRLALECVLSAEGSERGEDSCHVRDSSIFSGLHWP